jgi:hypothetical protein
VLPQLCFLLFTVYSNWNGEKFTAGLLLMKVSSAKGQLWDYVHDLVDDAHFALVRWGRGVSREAFCYVSEVNQSFWVLILSFVFV